MAERFDLGLVTSEKALVDRISNICAEFKYTVKNYGSIDEFLETTSEQSIVIAFIKDDKNPNIAAELAQSAKHVDPSSYVICGVAKSLPKETAAFAKKSGADLILLEDELFTSSKLEYTISQTLKASYLPLKSTDLAVGKELPFDVFHLMPQRGKFIKFLFKGDTPDEGKIKKIAEVGEVYVHRSKTPLYKKYIEELGDNTTQDLARKCRAQFITLFSQYSAMVLQLTDQSERTSFGEGDKLLNTCRTLCQDLLATLEKFSSAWDIVNNSSVGEFGSVERAPAVAAYSSLFAIKCGLKKIDDMMLVSLLIDLGVVFLNPSITKKIRDNTLSSLTPEELLEYQKFPLKSLEVILDRKIAISEKMRSMFLAVHERADGKGFPKGLQPDKLTYESQMIQFSKLFDQRTTLRLGQARQDAKTACSQLIEDELRTADRFTLTFLEMVKRVLSELG